MSLTNEASVSHKDSPTLGFDEILPDGPIAVMVPYVSHNLLVGCCMATWFPTSKSESLWACWLYARVDCLWFPGLVSLLR